ncbi:hypothetical protein DIURU_001798 [Diutina rugosa]|uniref:Ubiquitin-protein ligase E3A N-terminal zinc-binding domain-containing protein n=1 Tax=Diutina rugosa TaxID=5481 RepID=A0A642UT32_DIURU|nr:uncharacterized protein DIURU_001798 [Diutina rugosa]KAA8904844.1 hypothetical protein DIURU_001798 [Diutina rugosa]
MNFDVDYQVDGFPYTDKAYFPQYVLERLVESIPEAELPHPLIFKGAVSGVHMGVKEFREGSESIVGVSQQLYDRLKVESETVQLVSPPKATHIKLKPKLAYDIFNYKFFLEAVLPKYYTTVTAGQTLVVEHQGLRYELAVEEVNNSMDPKTYSIVDADIELEINDGGRSAELKDPVDLELGVTVTVDDAAVNDSNFVPTIYKVAVDGPVVVSVDGGDVIVAETPFLNMERFQWTTMDQETTKEVVVVPEGKRDIYVVAFKWTQGSVTLKVTPVTTTTTETETIEAAVDDDSSICPSCGRAIPSASFALHVARCQRMNQKCADCGQPKVQGTPHYHCIQCKVASSDPSFEYRHHKLFHETNYTCECPNHPSFSNYIELAQHRATECSLKPVLCQFCHLVVPQEESDYHDRYLGITHHENECGNKTTECYQCQKVVRVKDLANHLQMHELNKRQRVVPIITKCSNRLCVNASDPQSNSVGLCGHCFGPLYTSVHDPTGAKLASRMERRYILQMSKGCGWLQCPNQYCRTGKPMGENLRIFREELKPQIPRDFWYCVDESMDHKRRLVESLSEVYPPESVLEAAQQSSPMEEWLERHAIKV